MLSIPTTATTAAASSSISTALRLIPRSKSRFSKILLPLALNGNASSEFPSLSDGGNYGGIHLDDTVSIGSEKTRIDSWISSRIPGISRVRVQFSIRSGLVTVNGRKIEKVSHIVKGGDVVSCMVPELQPLKAEPEEIPLNIVYEDAQVLVVNKPAHMVYRFLPCW